ncbi:MAG: histidine kinase N-terminal 7TM domain-containing protein, partial [Patescibacteria group bacterium]
MFIYFTYIPVLLILLLLFFIFFSFKKNISRKIFSFFILSIAIWVFTLIFADSGKDYNTVLLWTRLAIAGPIIAIYLLVIFSFVFPSLKPKFTLKKAIYLSFPALVMLFFINTNHNVESITIERWGSNPQPGFLYNVLLIYVVVYLIIALRNFYKSYKENTGIYKKQIVYLFIGLIFFISTAVFTNLLSILFNFAQYSIYGPISSLFFIGCVGYAISRYRLMDIRIVLRKSMVMIAVLVTIVGGAGIITYANSMYWNLMRPMWMGMLT